MNGVTKLMVMIMVAIIVMALMAGVVLRENRTGDVSDAYDDANDVAMGVHRDICDMAFGPDGTMPDAEHLVGCYANVK